MARVEIDYTDAQRTLQAIARKAPRLKRDISKALRASANEVKEKQQAEVGSGSLSSRIANSVRVEVRYTGRYTGVNIRASGARMGEKSARRLPRYVDRGSWRHPVYGNRSAWVVQQSWAPGWFTDTGRKELPEVRKDMEATLNDFVRYLAATS